MKNIKIAVVIPTYQRSDGKTKEFLNRALKSVMNQSYRDFTVFLIGDKYEDNQEFIDIYSSFFTTKIKAVNLSYALERDRYKNDPEILWRCGGVNANNVGIDLAIRSGFEWIAHLDHDDYWENDHLMNIAKAIQDNPDVAFICTKSNYRINYILPTLSTDQETIEFLPNIAALIHSSTCINFAKIPLRYEDTWDSYGTEYPSDGWLWIQMRKYLLENNLKSIAINKLTCFHPEERSIVTM